MAEFNPIITFYGSSIFTVNERYTPEINFNSTSQFQAEYQIPQIKFDDFYSLPEIPNFILCNPNREQLFALGGISERTYKPRFNALSEITFRADKYIDDIEMPYYDYLHSRRTILVENVGYFLITDVDRQGDGVRAYKNIIAKSLEVEFANKDLAFYKRTSIQFYNAISPDDTLIDNILSYMPGWSVGYISGNFISKYRSFDVSGQKSIYNFLMNDVEQAYKCVFWFDTYAKTINATSVEKATKNRDIYISYDNLVQKLSMKESTEELVTALNVYGGNELDINQVNPLGTNTIYNFEYFERTDPTTGSPLWMSQALVDVLDAWEQLVSGSQVDFADTYTALTNRYDELAELRTDMSNLKVDLAAREIEIAALIRAGLPITDANNARLIIISQIAGVQNNIDAKNTAIDELIDNLQIIADGLALDNTDNFTTEQQKQLQPFIIQSTYTNANIIQTDSMTSGDIQRQAQKLYDQGQSVLESLSEPRYTFSIDSANFMIIKEFEDIMKIADLGSIVNLEIDEGIVSYPVLLGIDIDFDNPQNFKLMFGNRLRLDDEAYQFSDLMNEMQNTVANSQVNSLMWSNWNDEYKDDVSDFIESALDGAVNNVTSGSGQEIIIDGSGLRGRQLIGNEYSPEQLWVVNNMIAFTDDNWNNAKIAIGEIEGPNGQNVWGIVAEKISKKQILKYRTNIYDYN